MSVVGIDLGGTKVAAASLGASGLSKAAVEPTRARGAEAVVDQLAGVVAAAQRDGLEAVGVGVPSVVEFASGRVVSSVNVPLADLQLRRVLAERLGVPVFVDNDAAVAALAEAHDERLRLVTRHLVMLTIGTGVGGGIVIGGRIFRGATGGAAELGHTIVGLDVTGHVPRASHFPQPGSLESIASGHALDRLSEEGAEAEPQSALGRRRALGETVLGGDAVRAARDGDAAAARIVELWAERIGLGVANAINTFDPEVVVLGGGGGTGAGDLILGPAIRIAEQYVHPGLGRLTEIRLARHGVRAGVLGAALLARQELESASARNGGGPS